MSVETSPFVGQNFFSGISLYATQKRDEIEKVCDLWHPNMTKHSKMINSYNVLEEFPLVNLRKELKKGTLSEGIQAAPIEHIWAEIYLN